MCGIAAIHPGNSADLTIIDSMILKIAHRGDDQPRTMAVGNCHLGISRLKIVDFEGGVQPMFNEDDSIAVVFNGEIYNFLELRTVLEQRGHRFRTKCDTEVIVHLYEDYGTQFLRKLDGMFAFIKG